MDTRVEVIRSIRYKGHEREPGDRLTVTRTWAELYADLGFVKILGADHEDKALKSEATVTKGSPRRRSVRK